MPSGKETQKGILITCSQFSFQRHCAWLRPDTLYSAPRDEHLWLQKTSQSSLSQRDLHLALLMMIPRVGFLPMVRSGSQVENDWLQFINKHESHETHKHSARLTNGRRLRDESSAGGHSAMMWQSSVVAVPDMRRRGCA
jgi:hypothetical protein